MATGILHTHYLVVILFVLIYVVKTILLLSDKNEMLAAFTKKTRVFEIVISVLFLATGIYLSTQLSYNGKYDYLFYIKIIMVFASIPIAVVGFRKSKKGLAVLSLLLLLGSFGLGEAFHKRKGISKDVETVSGTMDAKALYSQNCASCHGGDGKLGIGGAKDLTASLLDQNGIKEIIIHGKGLMPAAVVNEEEAVAIAEYVNSSIKSH